MTSVIESLKSYWYTPLDENEQKGERKSPMETTSKMTLEQLGAERYNMLRSWFARKNYDDMFISTHLNNNVCIYQFLTLH